MAWLSWAWKGSGCRAVADKHMLTDLMNPVGFGCGFGVFLCVFYYVLLCRAAALRLSRGNRPVVRASI